MLDLVSLISTSQKEMLNSPKSEPLQFSLVFSSQASGFASGSALSESESEISRVVVSETSYPPSSYSS